MSRFLANVDCSCVEAFRTLFEQQSFAEGWTTDTIGGIFDRQGRRRIVFDVDATEPGQRGNGPCPARMRCLSLDADSMPSVRQVTQDASAVRSCEHAPQRFRYTLESRVGIYAGKGNGDYREELASTLQAITSYLKLFAFSPEMALVRLDGQYGDASVVAQIMFAHVHVVTRGRGYQLLEHPQIQRVLAHPPTARVSRMNTGEVVELFDGGWLPLDERLPLVRVIVARHPAPPPGKSVKVGKRIDEWSSSLILMQMDFSRDLVLGLDHGRGAFEAVLTDEDVEIDPDRWCSYTECGQELWQIA